MTTTLAPKVVPAPAEIDNPLEPSPAPSLARGKPISICFGEAKRLDYFLYVPHSVHAGSPLVCAVHGLRRSAAQQIFQLKELAETHGMILFAPLFAREQFHHFQKLAQNEAGVFPEDAFDASLDDCLSRLEMKAPRLFMFGFSGGAQFAHRYALIGSKAFDKMALMAPGWFTMPDPQVPYPYGLKPSEELGERELNPKRALTTKTLVMVGERDTKRTASLNQDLLVDEHQGKNRLSRCQNWVNAMQDAQPFDAVEDLQLVKGGGHNLEKMIHKRGMGERMFDWFAS